MESNDASLGAESGIGASQESQLGKSSQELPETGIGAMGQKEASRGTEYHEHTTHAPCGEMPASTVSVGTPKVGVDVVLVDDWKLHHAAFTHTQ